MATLDHTCCLHRIDAITGRRLCIAATFSAIKRPSTRHYRSHASPPIKATYESEAALSGPVSRRALGVLSASAAAAAAMGLSSAAWADTPFVTTASGLRIQDIRQGSGVKPRAGDLCVVHWSGYTSGYQGKRIDNTSVRDEPYEFILGANQAIPAFEEAVAGMVSGGLRRVEVPGAHPELSYARERSERFANELFGEGSKYRYRKGPQPKDFDGERALDFVLDNPTLQDFNRTLLFDIKLLSVRKRS